MIDTLGGFRLLRSLGAGPRAEVFLAHPLGDGDPAVLKIYGEGVSVAAVATEVEALERAAGEHVVRVLDVMSPPEGPPALVLSRHAAGSLARLLAERPSLEAGEAITILAPLALALARLHDAGVAHGAITASSVLFDGAGSPTLACFGRAVLIPPALPPALLDAEQSVISDVVAFGALAAAVLERAGAHELAERARVGAAPGQWLTSFADALFGLAEPSPVALEAARVQGVAPARVVPVHAPVFEPVHASEQSAMRLGEVPRRLVERVSRSVRAVRRPVWVAAGLGLAALVVALVGVPQNTPATTPALAGSAPSGAEQGYAAAPSAGPVGADAVAGDDPTAAAVLLIAAREQCIRDLSIECLASIDQAGSSALDADRRLIESILGGAAVESVLRAESATLVQRLGDSALVMLSPATQPASLLLVKGEAGWRIRDYLEQQP